MAIRVTLALFIFIFTISFLGAQSPGYHIVVDEDKQEPRFVQRLVWKGGDNALRYEVEVERREGRSYRRVLLESTTSLFLDVSLPHGEYRFSVIAYDILDRPVEKSPWVTIQVRHALKPEIAEVVLESEAGGKGYTFRITGKNLDPQAEIFFRGADGGTIVPVEVIDNKDGSVSIVFEKDQLGSGEYDLFIKNPGGLDASLNGIEFQTPSGKKPFVMSLSALWAPAFLFYAPSSESASLASAAVCLGAGFPAQANFFVGPELTVSWRSPQMLTAGINLFLEKRFADNAAAFKFRLGAEYSLLHEDQSLRDSVNIVAGASLCWNILSFLYIEAGVDYHYSTKIEAADFVRPLAGIGVSF